MSLQQKIIALFLALGVVFLIGTHAGLNAFVMPAFEDFEQESANANLKRVKAALDAELHALEIINREYSEWDHTYEFARGERNDYISENLDVSYWTNIDLNGMLFFNAGGELLWGDLVDTTATQQLPFRTELATLLAGATAEQFRADAQKPRLGLLQASSGPMLVSALPIRRSDGKGTPAGQLVVLRHLNPSLVAAIGERTGVESRLYTIDDRRAPAALLEQLEINPNAREHLHLRQGANELATYQVLQDVSGKPAFVLHVTTPRTISSIGGAAARTTLIFIAAATILFLLGAWLFTRRWIVSPIESLTQHISHIRKTGDLERSFESDHKDEIGLLAREFSRLAQQLGKATREIESARDQALAISNAKSEFLAKMSHEIRTPMNGVIGMVELLANTPLDRVQKRYMHSISESADNLLEIISDILDISKIEAGKLELDTRPFNLNSFITDITSSLSGLAEKKGLRLNSIVPDGPALIVEADPLRLRQVLTNLLGNAIKFTKKGGVLLKVTAASEVDDITEVTFEVIDTGIGIAPEKQRRIFKSFAQEDGSTTRRYGGTGLGLAISSQLVDMMDSEISLQSEPGSGSTFTFVLRLRTRQSSDLTNVDMTLNHIYGELDSAAATMQRLQGRVLVAEDNVVNQAVAVNLLESMGIESVTAEDGQEAVDLFSTESFDAILMDCQMPELDGYEATEAIRRLESARDAAPVTIIAVTANAMAGDMERCLAAGMDDYLRKPYKGDQLHAVLAKTLKPAPSQGQPDKPEPISIQLPDSELQEDVQIIDDNVLQALAVMPQADDHELVNQVIESYLNTSLDLMTRLGDAIDRNDTECVRTAAHTLKASSANVGATGLAELCAAVEMSTRRTDRASAVTLQRQIREEYARVVQELKQRITAAA